MGKKGPDADEMEKAFQELKRVMMGMHGRLRGSMVNHGLTPPQFMLMMMLRRHPRMSVKELAERLDVTPGNITGILDRLEGNDIVYRARDRKDRRSVNVRLTEKGLDKVNSIAHVGTDEMGSLFADFSKKDLAQLRALLSKIRLQAER